MKHPYFFHNIDAVFKIIYSILVILIIDYPLILLIIFLIIAIIHLLYLLYITPFCNILI